jgi:hypothetical protein
VAGGAGAAACLAAAAAEEEGLALAMTSSRSRAAAAAAAPAAVCAAPGRGGSVGDGGGGGDFTGKGSWNGVAGCARVLRSRSGAAHVRQRRLLAQQISHQQPANSTFLSEQISTSHQPPANRTGCEPSHPGERCAPVRVVSFLDRACRDLRHVVVNSFIGYLSIIVSSYESGQTHVNFFLRDIWIH